MTTAAWLLHLLAPAAIAALPASLPAPPPVPIEDQVRLQGRQAPMQIGQTLRINGQQQQARWQLREAAEGRPLELWLPLEVLQNQLGMASRSQSSGTLKLEWYGRELEVPPAAQRSLDDEVAVDVSALLGAVGVSSRTQGSVLALELPAVPLLGVRSSRQRGLQRVVLDLAGPALIRQEGDQLWLSLNTGVDQRSALVDLGLLALVDAGGLQLKPRSGRAQRVFSLGEPARVVIDLGTGSSSATCV